MATTIKLNLTPIQAAMLWNLVDAQADAGACVGGNTDTEVRVLDSLSEKLLCHHSKFAPALDKLRA